MSHQILRIFEVADRTGLARSSIYAKIQAGDFPRPIKLSSRSVGWLEADVNQWIERQISRSREGVCDAK
jgi:prophage regulatory protein